MSNVSSPSTAPEMDEVVNPEERMSEANGLKESGNESFKAADYKTAVECYEKALEKMENVPSDFEGYKPLKSVLYSNLSASYLGLSEPSKAISSANDALNWDPNNKKAQYRRALARFNAGNLDEAKGDCMKMLEEDKNNNNARMLLIKINQKVKEHAEAQKKAFGSLFDKVGGLYDDREMEMKNKKQKKYEDYTRQQREKGEEELDFAAWELKEEEEAKKRELERIEKVKKEEEKQRNKGASEGSRSATSASAGSSDKKAAGDEAEIDEEDRKIIQETSKMGYCYFGKNKPEGNLTNAPIPQKIETAAPKTAVSSKQSISSWNSKGTTYEEKDMSSWCRETLKELLSKATYVNEPSVNGHPNNIVEMLKDINIEKLDDKSTIERMEKLTRMMHRSIIKVVSVDNMECDAQIALIRATRRYMFDFSCKLKLEISIDTDIGSMVRGKEDPDESSASVYQAILTLSEISSEMEKGKTYGDLMKISYKDEMKQEHVELAKYMVDQFKASVTDRIKEFMDNYHMQ